MVIDLIGKRFGRYIVIKRARNSKQNKARWLCQCDCGVLKVVVSGALLSGLVKSCGCWSADAAKLDFSDMSGGF